MEPAKAAIATIHTETAAKLNFACHQCSFPYLRDLRVENKSSDKRLDDLIVTLSSDPGFMKPKSWRLDRLAPEGVLSIKDRDLELEGHFLLNLAESISGSVNLKLEHGGVLLAEESKSVELLAYNEWGGAGYMPELLPAFSVPNDPAVDRLLRDTSEILRRAGKPDGIDGYTSRSRQRVWEITSALYSAVSNLEISYVLPPASFERDGQKIRLPGQILKNRVATCLDLTMLFAAALEQGGLNPIVVLPHGHALVGVWLQPEDLSNIVVDEAEILRKRIQLNELLLFETTMATSHPAPAFSKAIATVADIISPERDDTFNAAIDIRRARAHRITPLGLKSDQPTSRSESTALNRVQSALEEAPVLPDFDDGVEQDVLPETPMDRLERWQRKLLDLSARNPLLNHRSTRTSLKLICPEPGLLEDKLAEGARISIHSVPQPTSQQQDEEIHLQRTGEVISDEYARDTLAKKQVLVDLPPDELSRRAVGIYRRAQTALQEGGANTLYLALGFLLWKHNEKDRRRFRAPLILLPVTLTRKSVRSGVRMLAHDDEPRFNTTLLELLRKDFAINILGLDGVLPTDQSGIDVNGIWNKVRKEVRDAPGFEVVEDVALGHFSFAKYLMWKDLVDRTDALRQNAIVKHLLDSPREPYPSNIQFVEGSKIDREYKPSDLLAPLPADSSQMAAIATADRGKDFVIIGPPGTGKSQSISNLIAHMLGKGKTILFVSEKTAALEVVYRRMKDIGLDSFCLQLHSNKARKMDVLTQLGRAWDFRAENSSEKWRHEADRLRTLRDRLNRFVNRLHLRRPNGKAAYDAIGVKVRDEELAARVTLSWPSADHHDIAHLNRMREAVDKLQIQAAAVDDISKSPFHMVTVSEWSPQWEENVCRRANSLSTATRRLDKGYQTLLKSIGISVPDHTLRRLDALGDLATILEDSWRKQTAFALQPNGTALTEALGEAAKRLKSYSEAQKALSCVYDPMAWRKLDGASIAKRWQAANAAWWLKRLIRQSRIVKEMKNAGAGDKPDPSIDAPVLERLRADGDAIDELGNLLSGFNDWKSHATNPDSMLNLQSLGQRVTDTVARLADDALQLVQLRQQIRTLLSDGNDLLAPSATVGRATKDFLAVLRSFAQESEEFEAVAGKSVRLHFEESENPLDAIQATTQVVSQHRSDLRNWCAWWRRRTEALDLNLKPLVTAIENGAFPVEEIQETFEAAYCTWWASAVIGEDEVLRSFSSAEHEADIERFCEADDRFQGLTAAYISAKLSGQIPGSDSVTRKSTWGILRHELQKKRRHKPVRQLMAEIPDVITSLAPCLMMSPLSVAQYLAADQALFDVVIFDEASQITVWDAVGCLARARQAIVVGDPKQMPPTNFFSRADDDPDGDIDVEGDLESILDEMLGASIPFRTLNLHYRSRRESLISFSNSRYYNNELITFPAPAQPDNGVRLIRPDGFYARGKARHNVGEAKAIVSEVVRRLTHEDPKVRKQSIGVVTFNSQQQTLIENLLDSERYKNRNIEWAFSTDSVLEPVFVKNLETVQGDERDVILFSVTYGPDQTNHVTMNFGPLNRDGGERRLNVALTRARSEMLVFSTLDSDRIDLSRTQARAVADLKHFLEYADRGPIALSTAVHAPGDDFESPFEQAVARALRDKGWDVHSQIGVSAYRIDLGVVDPDKPGIYLAGIECDGAMYHSSAYARERDKIRQMVLERLGWKLFRIWSTDWWTNRAKALKDLHKSLTTHLEAVRMKRKEDAARHESIPGASNSAPTLAGASYENASRSSKFVDGPMNEVSSATTHSEGSRSEIISDDTTTAIDQDEKSILRSPRTAGALFEDGRTRYVVTNLDAGTFPPNPELFYSEEYISRLSAMIDCVIDTEGPIHEDVLVRRIARHHGFKRAGRNIREIVIKIANGRRGKSQEDCGLFFWRKGTVRERVVPARHLGRDSEMRNASYICKEEICAIVASQMIRNDPREFARRIGIGRLSKTAQRRLTEALNSQTGSTANHGTSN